MSDYSLVCIFFNIFKLRVVKDVLESAFKADSESILTTLSSIVVMFVKMMITPCDGRIIILTSIFFSLLCSAGNLVYVPAHVMVCRTFSVLAMSTAKQMWREVQIYNQEKTKKEKTRCVRHKFEN